MAFRTIAELADFLQSKGYATALRSAEGVNRVEIAVAGMDGTLEVVEDFQGSDRIWFYTCVFRRADQVLHQWRDEWSGETIVVWLEGVVLIYGATSA